jgi:hypothetical protein
MALYVNGASWETPDAAGILELPPASQAANASATSSGATSFRDWYIGELLVVGDRNMLPATRFMIRIYDGRCR